jgi:hypothetical protein
MTMHGVKCCTKPEAHLLYAACAESAFLTAASRDVMLDDWEGVDIDGAHFAGLNLACGCVLLAFDV